MSVLPSLLQKIKSYEEAGYTPDEIIEGISVSPTYPDVAARVKTYREAGNSNDDILQGIKASDIETKQMKGFRGFDRSGKPIMSGEPQKAQEPPGVISAPQGGGLRQLIASVLGSGDPGSEALEPKREPGLYAATKKPLLQSVIDMLNPVERQMSGEIPWRSVETGMLTPELMAAGRVIPAALDVVAKPAFRAGKSGIKSLIKAFAERFPEERIVPKPVNVVPERLKTPDELSWESKMKGKPVTSQKEVVDESWQARNEAEYRAKTTAPEPAKAPVEGAELPAMPEVGLAPERGAARAAVSEEPDIRGQSGAILAAKNQVMGKIKSGNGFSLNPRTPMPENGYMVSDSSGGIMFKAEKGVGSEVDGWVDRALRDAERDSSLFAGGWKNASGEYFLDRSRVVQNLDEAIALGKKNGQEAIWDIAGKKEIVLPKPSPEIAKIDARLSALEADTSISEPQKALLRRVAEEEKNKVALRENPPKEIPQVKGLQYEGYQEDVGEHLFTETKTGSTFGTKDLSPKALAANRDRIIGKFSDAEAVAARAGRKPEVETTWKEKVSEPEPIPYKEPTTLELPGKPERPLPRGPQPIKAEPYKEVAEEPFYGWGERPKPAEAAKPTVGLGESGEAEVGYHYSKEPRGELRGAQKAEDTQWYSREIRDLIEAGQAHPEHPYVPAVNVYGPGVTPEVIVAHGGKVRHKVQYESRELYDLNKDPRGFYSMAKKTVRESDTPGDGSWRTNIAANLAKDAGFKGLKTEKVRYLFGTVPAEVGAVRAGLVPHMASSAVGAVVGGAVAPEGEKWQGALIGGGAGLAIGALALKKILKGASAPKGLKNLGKGRVEIPPIKEGPLTESIMKTTAIKDLGEPVSDALAARGVKRDPTKTMTQQIIEEVEKNPGSRKEIFARWGTSEEDFLQNLKSSLSLAARDMNLMSQYAKKLDISPEILEELAKAGKEQHGMDRFMYWWKRADNARRALLVSQLSTAMRNAEVQSGRFVIDAMEQGIASIFQKGARALGGTIKDPVGILDGFETGLKIFGKNKLLTNKILNAFPGSEEKLLGTYMSDIAPTGGKKWGFVDRAINIAGFFNRSQEFIIRRAVFIGKVGKTLENKGLDLKSVVESGKITEHLTEDELGAGIKKALEFTFAENAGGQAGRSFVNFINSVPGATWVMPFPRFLVNSLKFQYQYSPLVLLNLFSKAERSAIAEGNMKVLSRATVGSAMLGAAYLFRGSEYAGERAWEFKVPGSDRRIDMRPYNPLVGYLIVADLAKRWKDGTLHRLDSKDLGVALMGGNIRAGAGLYAVDKILDALSSSSLEQGEQKASTVIKEFMGEVVGGLATPVNQVKEFLSGMDDFTIKSKRDEPFLGPLKSKIPGWEAGMEPVYSPTRSGPRKTALPAIRQMTGLAISVPKNEIEKELDRLQFNFQEISPSTGIPKLDNLIAKEMGPLVEEDLIPLIKTKSYQTLSENEKAELLLEELQDMRKEAKEFVLAGHPELEDELEIKRIPRRTKAVLKEQGEIK